MKPKFTEEERKLIGRRIRDARNAEKLTMEQLAERCDCSPKHIGDVERGTVSASWPLAVKIGKALNTGVDYYLADTSDQYFDIQIDLSKRSSFGMRIIAEGDIIEKDTAVFDFFYAVFR